MRASRVLPALAVLVLGCGGKSLVVESDTEWAGSIDVVGAVQGRGNAKYELSATASQSCWALSKLTDAGTLRAYSETSTFFGLGNEIDAQGTTNTPHGQVSGCVR